MVIVSLHSIAGFCTIFFGYVSQTSLLQYWFYSRQTENLLWKIQSNKGEHVGEFYGLPIFSNKPHRAPFHGFIVLLNLLIASLVAGFTTESCVQGWTWMQFAAPSSAHDYIIILAQCLLAIAYENVVEYYWHRLMHTKLFYATFHKYHHYYKSPEPWDDMYIHPLEAFGYYCILYGPPFLFPIHCWAFLGYMVVMGVCGILDHSGIHFSVPGLYNTVDHDNHHLKFEVNYAFPFPYMDILHGTFDGEILGLCIKPARKRRCHSD